MPDPIAPPAPAAPAATPPPTPPPTDLPDKPVETSDALNQLDKMGETEKLADKPAEKPPVKPPEKAAPPKTPAKAPVKSAPDKPAEKPVEKQVEKELPADLATVPPKQLRDAYSALKTKHKALETELQQARTKPPVNDDPEKVTLRETLAQREKRLAEYEDHIRYVDYTKSEEYNTKYHQPYVNTAKSATAQVMELRVPTAEGTARPATQDDFWSIVEIPNAEDALAAAEKIFQSPTKANFVMQQRERVRAAYDAAEQAKAEFRTKGVEREKTTAAERERTQRETTAKWRTLNEQTIEESPDVYKPEDGDDEGNSLLEKGFERADAAFGGMITDPDTGQKRPPTPEESIQINSELRNKAGAFDRVLHRAEQYKARIAQLEQQIAEYEKSGPGGGAPPSSEIKPEDDSFDAAVDRLAASR